MTRTATATPDGAGAPICLYAVPTANSQRVAMALEELALPYQVRHVDRAADEQHGEAFRAINPAGMAPVIVDPSGPGQAPFVVAQSGAILLYLAEQTGRLLPAGAAARMRALQWLMHVLADVNATSSTLYFARQKVDAPHAPTVALFEQRLVTFLRDCDRELARGDWLAGDLSIADVALYPLVAPRREWLRPHGLDAVQAWADRMAARPATAAGMAAVNPAA